MENPCYAIRKNTLESSKLLPESVKGNTGVCEMENNNNISVMDERHMYAFLVMLGEKCNTRERMKNEGSKGQ
ncbi:hypothetical protein E2C01_083360 [Portunus trituberculatus]|uniref:Uncharacterized protein n=1 Tax=Portunus trituberculatus TaxID=210409 RepID=A0A5B7J102_PORTR|nr:hypothetical protein [Portunus trituberculatus]